MYLPKIQKIEIIGNPLALIVGESDITTSLSQKLRQGGCEVVELKDFPKSGKFNYIFQFGNLEKVKDSYTKFLKPNGKFLFIDYKNEDINSIIDIKDIKILRVQNLSPWYFQKLSDEILKITFTHTSKNIIDIRLNEDDKSLKVYSVKTKNTHSSEISKKVMPLKLTTGIVQKRLSKPILILISILAIFITGASALLYWQAIAIKDIVNNTQIHLESGDLVALNKDLEKVGRVIDVACPCTIPK